MSVSGINSYASTSSLTELLSQASSGDHSGPLGSKASSAVSRVYGANLGTAAGKSALEQALREITPNASGKITYEMISQHQQKLEKEFTTLVEVGLLLQGVPKDAEFRLIATSSGEMQILADDPEIGKAVEDFFAENANLAQDFLYIQALGNLSRTHASLANTPGAQRLHLQEIKAGLQADAWSAFFDETCSSGSYGYSSLLADFSSGFAGYTLGANYLV